MFLGIFFEGICSQPKDPKIKNLSQQKKHPSWLVDLSKGAVLRVVAATYPKILFYCIASWWITFSGRSFYISFIDELPVPRNPVIFSADD